MKFAATYCPLMLTFALSSNGFSQGGDDCANAQLITGLGPHTVDLMMTTASGSIPPGCTNIGVDEDVWMDWMAPSTGTFSVEVCSGSAAGWGLAVWDGCGGTVLTCKEFNCQYEENRVIFQGVQGTVYKIQVSSPVFWADGTLRIEEVFIADNDDCANATEVLGYGTFPFDLANATTDGPTDTNCFNVTNGVWYRWTSPYDRTVTIRSSEYGLHLSIIDGCGGEEIQCNRGFGLHRLPQLHLPAQPGTEYLIRLSSPSGSSRPAGWLSIEPNTVIQDPTTSRAYSLIYSVETFQGAQTAAQSYRYRGVPGHLVTINSQVEKDYLLANFSLPIFTRIGLYQDQSDPNYSEPAGAWKWVTGEPLNFTDWLQPNRPDNSMGDEHWGYLVNGQWEDEADATGLLLAQAQIVEWPLDPEGTAFCEPAEPNSIGLATQLYVEKSFVAPALVRLEGVDGPPAQFGYFLVGTAAMDPGVVAGNGRLCLDTSGGNLIGRYNAAGTQRNSIGIFDEFGILENLVSTSSTGTGYDLSLELPFPGGGLIGPGQTWHFQLTHREPGGAFNFSNGVSVTF